MTLTVEGITEKIRIADIEERISILEELDSTDGVSSVIIKDVKYLLKIIKRLKAQE